MKRFILLGLVFFGLTGSVAHSESKDLLIYMELKDLNLSPVTSFIKFNDISAEKYVITASCKDDGTTVTGSGDYGDKIDLCTTGRTVYPNGKDIISIGDYIFATKASTTSVRVHIAALDEEEDTIDSTYMNVNLKNSTSYSTDPDDLEIRVNVKKKTSPILATIKWDGVGAQRYTVIAECTTDATITGSGTSGDKIDLCDSEKTIYANGFNTINGGDFYFAAQDENAYARIEVVAFDQHNVINRNSVVFEFDGSSDSISDLDSDENEEEDMTEDEKIEELMQLIMKLLAQLIALKNQ